MKNPEHKYLQSLLKVANAKEGEKFLNQSESWYKNKLLSSLLVTDSISEKELAAFHLELLKLGSKVPEVLKRPFSFVPPPKLNTSQCSSQITAMIKGQIIENEENIFDLTMGWGVDAFYLSQNTAYTAYEIDPNIFRINNFNHQENKNISVKLGDGLEAYKNQEIRNCLVYVDPARRDENKRKLINIEDCRPDVSDLPQLCLERECRLLIKLSPMLDVSHAYRKWGHLKFSLHLISIKNELKEILLHFDQKDQTWVHSSNHGELWQSLALPNTMDNSTVTQSDWHYWYDPNPAFRKLARYDFLAKHFSLSILYQSMVSETLLDSFPGKCFKCIEILKWDKKDKKRIKNASLSVVCRHPKLKAPDLETKFQLKPHPKNFLIVAYDKLREKGLFFLAERLY